MRIPVVLTVVALGLPACHRTTTFLNGDELARAPAPAAADAPRCNDLEQKGPEVSLAASQALAPSPAGGKLEDGTYVLTSSTLHTKERLDGTHLVELGRTTMVVSGATAQMIRTTPSGRERRTTVVRESDGVTATLHTTCANTASAEGGKSEKETKTLYSVTPTGFQFINHSPAGTVVATYTKL